MTTKSNRGMRADVEAVLAAAGQGGRLVEARIMLAWERIVGREIAARSFPFTLAGGTLTVAVFNSVWMSQLQFFRDEMAGKVNRHLEEDVVSSVRLVLRKKPDWWAAKKQAKQPLPELTPGDRAEVDAACAAVADLELREVLRRVLALQAAVLRSR